MCNQSPILNSLYLKFLTCFLFSWLEPDWYRGNPVPKHSLVKSLRKKMIENKILASEKGNNPINSSSVNKEKECTSPMDRKVLVLIHSWTTLIWALVIFHIRISLDSRKTTLNEIRPFPPREPIEEKVSYNSTREESTRTTAGQGRIKEEVCRVCKKKSTSSS